jgi:hypothetical protein
LAAGETLSRVGPVWVFFVRTFFALETPDFGVGKAWISLDSLVRIVTYQWVTRDFRLKFFRRPFSLMSAALNRNRLVLARRRAELFMGQA